MLHDLIGKVALVSGAGSGIGRGLAEALAARGMRVVATDISDDALVDTAAALASFGQPCLALPLDVRHATAWAAIVARAEAALGPVQLLCNVAGVTMPPTPLLDLPTDAWSWVIETNLTGSYHGAMAVAGRLRALGLPGHVVNTSSVQGLIASPGFGPYNASKFAIMGLSETLRHELAPLDIGVSIVCPGPTRGNIMANSQKIAPHLVTLGPPRARGGFSHFQTPAEVADKIVRAIERNQLFVITHPEYRPLVEARWAALDAAMGNAFDADAAQNICENEAVTLAGYRAAAAQYEGEDGQ